MAVGITGSWAQHAQTVKKPFELNFNQLTTFLELSPFQWNEVKAINDHFILQQHESLMGTPARQEKRMQQAIYGNLKLMKDVLTNEQYRKYIALLNVTNNNNQVIAYDELPDINLANVE